MEVNLEAKNRINNRVIANFSKLKSYLFLIPFILLFCVILFLFSQNALTIANYISIQKELFYFLNSKYSQFPGLIYNLTQIGDAFIFLSLLSVLAIRVPKLWEALLSASILSGIFSPIFKNIFAVPRPAAAFDNTTFTIIGPVLNGHNSLPSGHAITFFTVLTVLLFAFMPKKNLVKILWIFFIVSIGLLLVFTRVGLGAHYPLDVITGSCIGFISGIMGIFINRKYNLWIWINLKKYYPIFIVVFLVCGIVLINKILHDNLIVYYFALISIIVSVYEFTFEYLKK
jgi:membrane-associated phospholipid phosphatase